MFGIGAMITPRATPTPGQGAAPDPSLDPKYVAPAAPAAPAPVAPAGWQQSLFGSGDRSNAALIFGQGAVDANARAHALGQQGDGVGAAGAATSALVQGAGGLIARPAAALAQGVGYGIGALAQGAQAFGRGFVGAPAVMPPQPGVASTSTASGGGMIPTTPTPPAASPGSAVTSATPTSPTRGMPVTISSDPATAQLQRAALAAGDLGQAKTPEEVAANNARFAAAGGAGSIVPGRHVGTMPGDYVLPPQAAGASGGMVPLGVAERMSALKTQSQAQAAAGVTAQTSEALLKLMQQRPSGVAAQDAAHDNMVKNLLAFLGKGNAIAPLATYGQQ